MRLVYLFCIFLTIAVCSIARNDAAPTNEENIPANNSQVYTAAEPGKPVTSGNPTAVTPNASINISNITIASSDVKPTNATKNNDSEITTSLPTIPTKPTTTTTTTKIPPTTSNKPNEQPITTTISTTTSKQTTVSPTSVTTAIPISTKEAPPHKERQFDGLSFVGGIILIICLMAIGIFSYKFYRTLNERNYRTL
ncbi:uncharacterized protein LOC117222800 [Megalopta genalis]|uniref:uncharacterized protein LOC117222800 n=1 Tax=Megalopta genalis TaxID=115081 RepID=UPI003FCF2A1F